MAKEKDFDRDAIATEIKKQAGSETSDDADTIAKAAERMEALGFDPSADEVVPEDEDVPAEDLEEVPEDSEDEEETEEEVETEEDTDPTPEDKNEEPADTDGGEVDKDEEAQKDSEQEAKPQLSDAYYRAAIHSGMTKEDVTNLMKVDSELALKTFGNLYESMNRTSQEFADLGRFKKQQANKSLEEAPVEKPGFAKIDTADMRAELGDNVADQFDAQQEQLAQLFKNQSKAAPVANSNDEKLLDANAKHASEQIETFFNSKDMAKYEQTYGVVEKTDTEWTGLLPSAKMNRIAVIDSAIELIEGAAVAGREVSVPEAMERAHLMVTQPIRDKIIREDIMGAVIKRSKGITLKPSKKVAGAVVKSNGPKTDVEVEENAAARLAKVFESS